MTDRRDIQRRKWTLFGLTVVAIILQVIVIIVATSLIKNMDKPDDVKLTDSDWQKAKILAKNIVIAAGVISLAIQSLGLFGAYKENYCLTLTYAILMTLATLGSIGSAVQSPIGWASFILYLVITIVAYLFAQDIKRLRNVQVAQGWNA